MQIKLAQPRSFCAGVVRAIDIVKTSLEIYEPPVYVLHEIVHNRRVIEDLQKLGAVFVETLDEVPSGFPIIFSAHGVTSQKIAEARQKNLEIIDATCPLVAKVHKEVENHAKEAREVILIGHAEHVEVIGTLGRYNRHQGGDIYLVESLKDVEDLQVKNPKNLGYVTQTTLSMFDSQKIIEALQARFPYIQGPAKEDICYATQNRQNAVVKMAPAIDLLLVVGAKNSSNSNRLREVGEEQGIHSFLIQSAKDIKEEWFFPKIRIGLTAGASAPEILVQEVLDKLRELGVHAVQEMEAEPERVSFSLPQKLKEAMMLRSQNQS